MEYLIKDSANFIGKEIILKGWVYNKRSSGSIVFLQLRDGTGFIQGVVIKSEVVQKVFDDANIITLESSVIIKGIIKEEKRSHSGYELTVKEIEIVSLSEEYPIAKKDHGPDFLLSHRHLWLRSRKQWAIQRIRNTIINAIYEHLNSENFIKIDAPIFTPNACEGTTTLYPVPYLPAWKNEFNKDMLSRGKYDLTNNEDYPFVYLSQSGQLYIEAAIFAHGKVFDFGPTFRAEKSKTRRHLTEFWMMDAEAAFTTHNENMKIQERLIAAIVKKVIGENKIELTILERDIEKLKPTVEGNYKTISHKEAIDILRKNGVRIGDRDDFGAEAETILSKQFNKPFFIEKYPKEIKAFYMKEDPEDLSRVLNSDMLTPEGFGEIIGGSQREDNYETLLSKIEEHKLNVRDFQWYLDLRKYGSVPHSGFGVGLERLVTWICNLEHLRESIPFPRMMERFNP
jgi:asparaginyl-tRNA synthetase